MLVALMEGGSRRYLPDVNRKKEGGSTLKPDLRKFSPMNSRGKTVKVNTKEKKNNKKIKWKNTKKCIASLAS